VSDTEHLLYWLSHRAEGSWETFSSAVSGIENHEGATFSAGNLARALSEMAHAEFFIGGSRRWAVFCPAVAGLRAPGHAVLVGARTRRITDSIKRSSEHEDVEVTSALLSNGLLQVRLTAESDDGIDAVARQASLSFAPDFALRLCGSLRTVTEMLSDAAPTARPANWGIRSFDLAKMAWADGYLNDTAYEFVPTNGISRFAVARRGHALVQLDKRTAAYAAAYINRIPLLRYQEDCRKLMVPQGAPMPSPMARVAAMCHAAPATADGNWRAYADIPPDVASILMTSAGQTALPPTFPAVRRG